MLHLVIKCGLSCGNDSYFSSFGLCSSRFNNIVFSFRAPIGEVQRDKISVRKDFRGVMVVKEKDLWSFRHAELLKKGMKISWIGWGSAENCRVELVPVSDWSWGDKQKWIQSLRSVSSHPGTPLSPEAWFMSIRSLETIINMMCVGMGEVDHHLQRGLHQVKTATHSLRYLIHFFVDDHPAFFVWTIIWFFFSLGWPGGSSPQSIHLRRFLFLKVKAGLICIFKRRSMGTGSYQAELATTGKLTSIWSRWERNLYHQ